MTMERRDDSERRRHRRYHHPATAAICWGDLGEQGTGSIADLSTGGCQVAMERENGLRVGDTIEINLESSYLSFQAFGLVRRVAQNGRVLGISFQRSSQRGLVDRKMEESGVAEELEDRRKVGVVTV